MKALFLDMQTFHRNQSLLHQSKEIYEHLTDYAAELHKSASHAESVLSWIEMTATFAWFVHGGRFADDKLENIALKIGENLERLVTEKTLPPPVAKSLLHSADGRRKILHVLTVAYKTGGHTRLLYNWIKNDNDSCHSVLITEQGDEEAPAWLSEAVKENGGSIVVLPAAGKLSKAYWLRSIVQSNADLVVLHHHPNDVLPLVAFATDSNPSVAVLNHADHVFWLGASITDLIIDFRANGKRLSEQRRFAKKSLVLPMPIMPDTLLPSYGDARRKLNISEDQIVLLSIGSACKYKPTKAHNFFRTVIKILNRNPQAHMYLVGVEWDDNVEYLQEAKHERFHFLGVLDQPLLYQVAADLFLNGFPYGAGMALLETCAMGACPVLAFSPESWLVNLAEDEAFDGVIDNPKTEEEYIAQVEFLIRNKEERNRIASQVAQRVVDCHRGRGWEKCLQPIYSYLERTRHEPRRIPSSNFGETDDDLALSALTMMPAGPLLLTLGRRHVSKDTLQDMMVLFVTSLKVGDTRLAFRQLASLPRHMEFKRLLKLGQVLGGVLSISEAAGVLAESLKLKNKEQSYEQLQEWLQLFKMSSS